MTTSKRYRIIYVWQGARHVHSLDADNLTEARGIITAMRKVGFKHCWAEPTREPALFSSLFG